MTQHKIVAWGIIVSLSLALITAFIEPINEDNWFTLAGLGMFAFGIWAAVLLFKKEN